MYWRDPIQRVRNMDHLCRIRSKSVQDIAREWLTVKGFTFSHKTEEMLAEFATLYAKQLEFERDTYKKLAEDALAIQPIQSFTIIPGQIR